MSQEPKDKPPTSKLGRFARLASLVPAVGGPYAYTRLAYGDFAGFLIAWGYWISIWTSLPVIAIAFAGVMVDLFPALANRFAATVLTLGVIWAVVLVNLRGVHAAGVFAQVTTYAKLLPFGAVAIIGRHHDYGPAIGGVCISVLAIAVMVWYYVTWFWGY